MLELRKFTPEDAVKILGWTSDEVSFRQWSADRYGQYPISPEDIVSAYENASGSGKFFAYTAYEGDTAVGHMIIRFPGEDNKEARFGFIIVDPERRRQGFGRQMIELAKKLAAEKDGAERATLGVFANNEAAYRCYLSAGFREIPDTKEEYYHIFDDDWLCIEMECEL